MAYPSTHLAMPSLTVHEGPRTYAPIVTQLVTQPRLNTGAVGDRSIH
jgi:hypothetical protein